MKRILCSIVCCLALLSCEKGGNATTPKDELLDKTAWEHNTYYPGGGYGESVTHNLISSILSQAGVPLEVEPQSELVCDTLSNGESRTSAQIRFDENVCHYTHDSISITRVISYTRHTNRYTVKEGTWEDTAHGAILYIEPSSIQYTLFQQPDNKMMLCSLDSLSFSEFIGRSEIHEEQKIELSHKSNYTLEFIRSGDEVIMKNEKLKWIGMIDRDEWTMTVTQIVPSHKDIGTFGLK